MDKLPKIVKNKKKRVGRGYGSAKGGHTVGRGQKGQKSRSKVHILFEGVKVKKSLLRRLPLQRGKSKFHAKPKPIAISLNALNIYKEGAKVNLATLVSHNLISERDASKFGAKILSGEGLTKKLSINMPISESAEKNILKLGGKIIK